jgi:hypothetical protein
LTHHDFTWCVSTKTSFKNQGAPEKKRRSSYFPEFKYATTERFDELSGREARGRPLGRASYDQLAAALEKEALKLAERI